MKKNQIVLALFLTVGLSLLLGMSSCETNPENEAMSSSIIGTWANREIVNDSLIHFERIKNPDADMYYISFLEDESVLERKNAGWCGTPPVAMADFDGSWVWDANDSIFHFSVGYWGGMVNVVWKIMDVNEDELTVYEISSELEPREEFKKIYITE